ncbi:MAG TPA: glycosyltransferase family 4 protein [Acidobacteriota bacterium]|nr:glycosyltransferase family 4 protein [Acidobacteriota bacterium]
MKIAIVIQRYGTEITGGSEHLCRLTAERLARKGHEIDVLTSCAKDYFSWKNEYTQGRSVINGVTVYRFPTTRTRDLESFNKFSEQIYYNYHTTEDEMKWLEDQGPMCPGLVDFLKSMHRSYDRILFYTYLYYPTVLGMQIAPEKSVLVPTAHDEPAIKLTIFREVFARPYALIYNTEAEKDFVASLFTPRQIQQVGGIGVDVPRHVDKHAFRRQQGLMDDYFYYGGRIDAGKGCQEMIDFHLRKKQQNPDLPKLLLSGHLNMELPRDPSVVYLGYLSEEDKQAAMAGASCTIIPSLMESLSIVLLESLAVRTPVLVKEGSAVLKSHCVKSNAGLYYNDSDDFSACLDYLMDHPRTCHQMGINGQRYVHNNYSWPRVVSLYEQVLSQNSGY